MSTAAVPRPTLSAAVYDRLAGEILGGELAPGDPLPSERTLSAELDVNRHAVREAVKRLQQAGLVQVSHGGATRVRDWRATGGLDLLTQLPLGEHLVRDALEMRLAIGADAARRCAERAPAAAKAEIERLAAVAAGLERDEDLAIAYEELWARIVEGSGNSAYRLALNSLVRTGEEADLRTITLPEARDRATCADLVAAIAAGDARSAEARARALLERTLEGETTEWPS